MSSRTDNLFWSSRADRNAVACVYVITYSGDDMPPFYVGSAYLRNFTEGNYHGSPVTWRKLWNKNLEEYPERFRRKILKTFKTRKEADDYEVELLNHFDVVRSRLFVNMNRGGSKGFAECHKGRKWSEERRVKAKGHKPTFTGNHSEQTKEKMRGPRGPIKNPFKGKRRATNNIPGSLRNPKGEIINFNSANELAIEFGLHRGALRAVMRGLRKSHKGWTKI